MLLVGGGGVVLCDRAGDASRAGVTETVDRGEVATVVTATGVVNPVTIVQVGTYVSGPILALDVDFNSKVAKGQRVAQIDPAPFQVKVDQAEANLANAAARVQKARADLALKELTLGRSRELVARNMAAQSELDASKSAQEQAVAQLRLDEASVAQARSALAEARVNLAYTDIRSPVDGVVVSRDVDVGQTVAASFQTPTLFLIAQDLTQMQVEAKVSESDIGGVREGQAAEFSVDAWPGRTFRGEVVQVRNAPTTVLNVVTYDVVIGVDNASQELKPGMTATVSITTARREDVLRLPLRALRFRPDDAPAPANGDAPAAWLRDGDGALRRVEVKTGLRDDRHAELLSGDLAAGDAVAVAYEREEEPDDLGGSPLLGRPRRR